MHDRIANLARTSCPEHFCPFSFPVSTGAETKRRSKCRDECRLPPREEQFHVQDEEQSRKEKKITPCQEVVDKHLDLMSKKREKRQQVFSSGMQLTLRSFPLLRSLSSLLTTLTSCEYESASDVQETPVPIHQLSFFFFLSSTLSLSLSLSFFSSSFATRVSYN